MKEDNFSKIYENIIDSEKCFAKVAEEFQAKLLNFLFDGVPNNSKNAVEKKDNSSDTPIQVKKRIKRLSLLMEDETETSIEIVSSNISPKKNARKSNEKLLETADEMNDNHQIKTANSDESLTTAEQRSARPQRAAKLKSEKNLKEPKLNSKLRRPDEVKLEHEQRPSLILDKSKLPYADSMTNKIEDSVVILSQRAPSLVEISSDNDDGHSQQNVNNGMKKNSFNSNESKSSIRSLRIKIKREKFSLPNEQERKSQIETAPPVPTPVAGAKSKTSINQESDCSVDNKSTSNLKTTQLPQDKEVSDASEIKTKALSVNKNNNKESQSADEIESVLSTATTNVSSVKSKKNSKKKKIIPLPIKVERFSILENLPNPIASRTRNSKATHLAKEKKSQITIEPKKSALRSNSVYEDAIDLPIEKNHSTQVSQKTKINTSDSRSNKVINNTTVALSNNVPQSDETFCTNAAHTTFQVDANQATFVVNDGQLNPNATITVSKKSSEKSDATFQLNPIGKSNHTDSMVTARDSLNAVENSLITEDESYEKQSTTNAAATKAKAVQPTSAKAYKMPLHSKELFNPLVQSPVKMKVKAFENAANSTTADHKQQHLRLKSKKENAAPLVMPSNHTPVIGRIPQPALGRFLTPTQSSNLTPTANVKKAPNSTSKIVTYPKVAITTMAGGGSSSNLKKTNSTSTKTLTRENTAEDIRKGLQQLAEERKTKLAQKHLLAAQQREAKERERLERVNKLAKEREEKRNKKILAEQNKRELDEIQRKLRQEEEAIAEVNRLKAAKMKATAEKERELLQIQMKKQNSIKKNMLPPPPKLHPSQTSKYHFDMLNEYDSTDDEEKVTHKRPPPPLWSRSDVRGAAVIMQQEMPTSIIDSFFSVQPINPDLKQIFPNIDARFLKRNSSVLWSTPPRYSELPKY